MGNNQVDKSASNSPFATPANIAKFTTGPLPDPLNYTWPAIEGLGPPPTVNAMTIRSSNDVGAQFDDTRIYDATSNPTGDIGIALTPITGFLGGTGIIMPAHAPESAAAWEFLKFFYAPDKTYIDSIAEV